MVESDGVSSDVLLHPVLPGNVRIPVLGVGGVLPSGDGRSRFVGLSSGSVECHHPVVRLLDNQTISGDVERPIRQSVYSL